MFFCLQEFSSRKCPSRAQCRQGTEFSSTAKQTLAKVSYPTFSSAQFIFLVFHLPGFYICKVPTFSLFFYLLFISLVFKFVPLFCRLPLIYLFSVLPTRMRFKWIRIQNLNCKAHPGPDPL